MGDLWCHLGDIVALARHNECMMFIWFVECRLDASGCSVRLCDSQDKSPSAASVASVARAMRHRRVEVFSRVGELVLR